jgi:DNA-binding MarR family transcriptional regulator
VLSAKGHRLFEAVHERSHQLERALASRISADDMALAAAVLSKLRACIEGLEFNNQKTYGKH